MFYVFFVDKMWVYEIIAFWFYLCFKHHANIFRVGIVLF